MPAVQLINRFLSEWMRLAGHFADLPEAIRPSALEVRLVVKCIKPAVRMIVAGRELREVTGFLGSLGLRSMVRLDPRGEQERFEIVAFNDPAIAGQLAASFAKEPIGQYTQMGELLGYPGCCIETAAEFEFTADEQLRFGKANLVEIARSRSQCFHWELNPVLRESPLSQSGPVAVISHYPCRFDCAQSLEIARHYLRELECDVPGLRAGLRELLQLVIITWSGATWPAGFDAEQCGIVQAGSPGQLSYAALSRSLTPSGTIPDAGTVIDGRWLTGNGPNENRPMFDLHAPGSPQILRFD